MPPDSSPQSITVPDQRQACALYAQIAGSTQLIARIGAVEAAHAFERCFNRMERSIQSYRGRIVKHIGEQLMAVFDCAEDALHAACEMQARVEKLPAVSGVKLLLGIGVHHGPMAREGNDSSGDTVKLATRLARLAKGGQVLLSAPTVELLPVALQNSALALGAATVSLHGVAIPVFAVLWQMVAPSAPSSELAEPIVSLPPQPSSLANAPRLRLLHQGSEFLLEAGRTRLTMGRDPQCDLVINDPHASRQHGRIELRHNLFVLSDHSTNGTHVTPVAAASVHLQHGEFVLLGRGQLSFGLPAAVRPGELPEADEVITYELL